MRLRRNRLKTCKVRAAVPKKDKEGNAYIEYGTARSFQAEVWAAGGKLQQEMYGVRLPSIRNLRVEGKYKEVLEGRKLQYTLQDGTSFAVNDGICIYTGEEPDYKIVAIYPYYFLTMEVEKL